MEQIKEFSPVECSHQSWAIVDGVCWMCLQEKNQQHMREQLKDEFELDSIVLSIIGQFRERAKKGKQKYGTDLDRKDLSTIDWVEHAQQELMDGILYLEKLKQELSAKK